MRPIGAAQAAAGACSTSTSAAHPLAHAPCAVSRSRRELRTPRFISHAPISMQAPPTAQLPASRRQRGSVAAAAGGRPPIGPQPPPPQSDRKWKPEWVRIMEEDADVDEDVERVMRGTGGDPDKIRENMKRELENRDFLALQEGVEAPPRIVFQKIDVFDCWLWFEFYQAPSTKDRELFEGALRSWYVVGKLGGYNGTNLQLHYAADEDRSFFEYDADGGADAMGAFLHAMGEVEYKDAWARVNLDLGTADELAFDVLMNMMTAFSKDCCGLKRVVVGGQLASWRAPRREREEEDFSEVYKTSINPMKLPEGVSEELDLLDELVDVDEQGRPQSLDDEEEDEEQVDAGKEHFAAGRQRGPGRGGPDGLEEEEDGTIGGDFDEKDADEHGDVDFGELAARGRAMRRAMRQSMQDAGGSEREPGQTMEDYRRMWRRSRRGGGGSE